MSINAMCVMNLHQEKVIMNKEAVEYLGIGAIANSQQLICTIE